MVTRSTPEGAPPVDPNASNYLRMQDARQELWSKDSSPNLDSNQQNANGEFVAASAPSHSNDPSSFTSAHTPNQVAPGGGLYDGFEQVDESSWGGRGIVTPRLTGQSSSSAAKVETNPFLKRKMSQNGTDVGSVSSTPPIAPPSLPPAPALNQMNTGESSNPWGSSLDPQKPQPSSRATPPASDPQANSNIFDSSSQMLSHPDASQSLISLASAGSMAWDGTGSSQGREKHATSTPPDDWDLLTSDISSRQMPPQPPPQVNSTTNKKPSPPLDPGAAPFVPPSLPARSSSQPRRMVEEAVGPADASTTSNLSEEELTYFVKKIRWEDHSNPRPRVTPILVQNKNGPCPLLAIANTLALTVPRETQSDLIEALLTRTRITLDDLVTNVVNELFADYRARNESAITDPSAYAQFLKGLSKGMNVNPRFFPTEEILNQYKRNSLAHVHPIERNDAIPGSFEDSEEMHMFSKFGIPLIHGWLPAKGSDEYEALERQAASYEDATILISRQDELEAKLDEGLSEDETQMYLDSHIVKEFIFQDASTQLTDHGLDVIRKAMKPGTFAILFRNEHFSTLYRHPVTEELFALITDAGMASHEEMVWESLADTTGMSTEHFSGDFRPVGGPASEVPDSIAQSPQISTRQQQHHDPYSQGHSNSATHFGGVPQRGSSTGAGAASPRNEQEDRDFAFALQLQEEEEQRAAEARRRQESQLSERYIEQHGRPPQQGRSPQQIPPRGAHSASVSTTNIFHDALPSGPRSSAIQIPVSRNQTQGRTTGMRRTMLTPSGPTIRGQAVSRPADARDDDAPPSYEQAAREQAFTPPAGHPAHPLSTPGADGGPPPPAAGGVPVGGMGVRVNGSNGNGRRIMGPGAGRGYHGQMGDQQQAPGQGNGKKDKSDCTLM